MGPFTTFRDKTQRQTGLMIVSCVETEEIDEAVVEVLPMGVSGAGAAGVMELPAALLNTSNNVESRLVAAATILLVCFVTRPAGVLVACSDRRMTLSADNADMGVDDARRTSVIILAAVPTGCVTDVAGLLVLRWSADDGVEVEDNGRESALTNAFTGVVVAEAVFDMA